jgi:hypothetical protein
MHGHIHMQLLVACSMHKSCPATVCMFIFLISISHCGVPVIHKTQFPLLLGERERERENERDD